MLFPRGEDGWHLRIPYADAQVSALRNGHCVTQRHYYAYRLQIRPDTNACLLRGGRLLHSLWLMHIAVLKSHDYLGYAIIKKVCVQRFIVV